ncbi:MAG: DoxX family protein [Colwellia sp.]|nr:DoxX family protein [Colwellia sp.]
MSKTHNILTWIVTTLLAIAFIGAGLAKVSGQEMMVQSFNLFGLPDWFRIVIGSLEVLGGVSLLVPALTGVAAFGLSIIMVGAIACHVMFTPIADGIAAMVFFALLSYIYLTRKNVVPVFVQKYLVS